VGEMKASKPQEKARLFRLRNGRITGTLLDAKLLIREIHEILSSVSDIVLASNALPEKGKV
jgi:hypothetical protein